jgi:hypothetical protein
VISAAISIVKFKKEIIALAAQAVNEIENSN